METFDEYTDKHLELTNIRNLGQGDILYPITHRVSRKRVTRYRDANWIA